MSLLGAALPGLEAAAQESSGRPPGGGAVGSEA